MFKRLFLLLVAVLAWATPLWAKTFAVLEDLSDDYEVIVVNDGSRDGTAEVLVELQKKYGPRLRVVTHPKNRGYGAALRSGFEAATKELVFYTDGDGQYDPGELPKLIEQMGPDVGLVNGYKVERHDPRHRILIGWIYNRLARFLFRIRLRDIDCDFRLIRRRLLEEIRLNSTSGTICVELVRKLELSPYRVVEVPVNHRPRVKGQSKYGVGNRAWRGLVDCLREEARHVRLPRVARLSHVPRGRWSP